MSQDITPASIQANKMKATVLSVLAFVILAVAILLTIFRSDVPGNGQLVGVVMMVAYLCKYAEAGYLRRCIPKQ
jgi:Ca2+/Na+ antiporter